MFTGAGAQKVIPVPSSAAKCPPPSKAYIKTMCEYICKSGPHSSKEQPNPVASSNIKPANKHEDMFIFWA